MKTLQFKLIPLVAVAVLLLVLAPSALAQKPNPVATDLAVKGYASQDAQRTVIVYDIEVMNLGTLKATDVHVTQTLSSMTRFASVTTTNGKCTGGPVVQCAVKKLAAGKTMKIQVIVSRVRVPCAFDCAVPITSKVTVTTGTFDLATGNNSYVITVR